MCIRDSGKINRRIALHHLDKQVTEPVLKAKLTPDYPIGCKRILFSNEFYPALAQANVDVVTSAVTAVTTDGVIDAEGNEHKVDAIIYATGFDAQNFLESIDVTGVDGHKLAAQWKDGAHAYLGMYVPNFPNLFVTYGPNTNLGGGSIIYMLEAQARHMRQALDRLNAGDFTTCLLYTSDAADELPCVAPGGRRIIKKKQQHLYDSNIPTSSNLSSSP